MVRVYFRLELKFCDRLAPLCDGAAWRIIRADRYSIWWPEIQQVVRLSLDEDQGNLVTIIDEAVSQFDDYTK